MKAILDFISNICPITGNSIIDTILFAIIAVIAFKTAWILTGGITDLLDAHNSSLMCALHWIIRFGVFFALLGGVVGIVHFVRWIDSWPWWGYLIFGISTGVIITGIILIVVLRKKKKASKKDDEIEN